MDEWIEPIEYVAWRRRLDVLRRARHLTHAHKDALAWLLASAGPDGLYPADATVADAAGVSESTVYRARLRARELGILAWTHTRKMVSGKWRQGPNRYVVLFPTAPVTPRLPDRQSDGQRQDSKNNKRLTAKPAVQSLAAIAASRDASRAAAYFAKRQLAPSFSWVPTLGSVLPGPGFGARLGIPGRSAG